MTTHAHAARMARKRAASSLAAAEKAEKKGDLAAAETYRRVAAIQERHADESEALSGRNNPGEPGPHGIRKWRIDMRRNGYRV